jgi:hypothetical protein
MADCGGRGHGGFLPGLVWLPPTFLLNIGGFIVHLVYSAAKTNNWKRTTLPVAYMIEVRVIGVSVSYFPGVHFCGCRLLEKDVLSTS